MTSHTHIHKLKKDMLTVEIAKILRARIYE